jgi:hypothetical protein
MALDGREIRVDYSATQKSHPAEGRSDQEGRGFTSIDRRRINGYKSDRREEEYGRSDRIDSSRYEQPGRDSSNRNYRGERYRSSYSHSEYDEYDRNASSRSREYRPRESYEAAANRRDRGSPRPPRTRLAIDEDRRLRGYPASTDYDRTPSYEHPTSKYRFY